MSGEVPNKIGRYEVERLLGAGAMGNVYLARDPDLDRRVAIKTVRYAALPPDSLDMFLERFRNEARAAARLHHPNVVQIFDVGEEVELGPYLVFEYVPGSTLKQVLKQRGPSSPAAVCQLADEVAAALALAHAHGIIHRDIKPDNLLLTDDGHVKLADFGVARFPNADLTREGQFLGTPCYAAPETLREGHYAPSTDVFSLATVLYEAATGVRAFPGEEAVAVAHKVIHDEVEPPSSVGPAPRELDEIFAHALAKDPSLRFQNAGELAAMLREAYEASGLLEPVPAREPTGRFRAPEPEPPESPLAKVAIVVGLLIIGFALIVSYQRSERAPTTATTATVAPALREEPPRRDPAPRRPPRRRPVRDAATAIPSNPPANQAEPAPSPAPLEPPNSPAAP